MSAWNKWPLWRDVYAVCRDLGYHSSVAGNLAPVLEIMGCEHVSDVYGMDIEEITRHRGIGPKGAFLARALGAVDAKKIGVQL